MSVVERHRLQNTEYVDIELTITDEGEVWIQFEMADGPYFRVTADQLTEIVQFVEKHGEISIQPELVRA